MSTQLNSAENRKVTTKRLKEMKEQKEKIAMITAYDYTMATLVDAAGVDVILIGDSASNVMQGNKTTLPVTTEEMIVYAKSVVRGTKRAFVVVDMPFGSYQSNPYHAVDNAIKIMKETGADAVKLEGAQAISEALRLIITAGIPVVGHLGLTPQSINQFGSYGVRAKEEAEAAQLIKDAHFLEETGCCALVLEKIPAGLATRITSELNIPTIGIGAGAGTDGQVLVLQDMLGMNTLFKPKFLRQYANLAEEIGNAVSHYVSDVKNVSFPSAEESY